MKNKLTLSLAAALVFTLISQDCPFPEGSPLSMFIPSLGIECGPEHKDNEKLIVLDGDGKAVEYCFKLEEIFRKIFD